MSNAFSFETYAREWHRMMSKIWLDRLQLMGIYHRGMLQQSLRAMASNTLTLSEGYQMHATYSFLTYGIYVDSGVGNGYKRGNGGNLPFLDHVYRAEKGLGKARQRRPWFSTSWRISQQVLARQLSASIGQDFRALFAKI